MPVLVAMQLSYTQNGNDQRSSSSSSSSSSRSSSLRIGDFWDWAIQLLDKWVIFYSRPEQFAGCNRSAVYFKRAASYGPSTQSQWTMVIKRMPVEIWIICSK